ncbi:MAG: stage II sporulation protein P [Clostridia bacterium]|nr:stage II sporulation protein P [Clostridia bacterium]
MAKKYGLKSNKTLRVKIMRTIIFLVLSASALGIGSFVGNIIFDMDIKLIEKVDVNTFKTTLNNSIPLIDTVYNSGNISVSISGEIKNLIRKIFEFDINNPMTILNVESPFLNQYYEKSYKPRQAQRDLNYYKPNIASPNESPQKDKGKEYQSDQSSISMDEGLEKRDYTESNQVTSGKIKISNETKYKIIISELLKEPLKLKFDKRKGPKILIYHTHTTESYIKSTDDLNDASVPTWTQDPRYSVVRVGEELAQLFRKKYGIDVIHNGSFHDYPNYNGAYGRSLNTVEKILKSYPTIKVVLDIHRDGLGSESKKLRAVTKVNQKNAAQVMFVVGTNGNGLSHPQWKENLKFAVKLQEKLNEQCPGLAKPIYVSKNRYNQHVKNDALIIEVGGDGNTLEECLESTKYLAKAINDVISK